MVERVQEAAGDEFVQRGFGAGRVELGGAGDVFGHQADGAVFCPRGRDELQL